MVFSKLVVASQALLLTTATHGTFLAPQSLNEQGRTDTASEIQKIQKIESSLREVVTQLNGFSKKLRSQTDSILAKHNADVASDVAEMLNEDEEGPRGPRAPSVALTMEELGNPVYWVNAHDFLSNAEVSTIHIAVHALTALVTTYLDGLVPSAEQVMKKSYWQDYKKRDWSKFFLKPVNSEVAGYIVPSFAKLAYHLTMGLSPKIGTLKPEHKLQRAVFKKQRFDTPLMYPLADTWTADNIEVVNDVHATGNVQYKTKQIVLEAEKSKPDEVWSRSTAAEQKIVSDTLDTHFTENYLTDQKTPLLPDEYKYTDRKSKEDGFKVVAGKHNDIQLQAPAPKK